MKSVRASILILTLWVLSLLTIFAISLGFNVSQHLRFADHLQDRQKMYYLAKAGIDLAMAELENGEEPDADSLNEPWSNNEEVFKAKRLNGGYLTVAHQLESVTGEEQEITLYGIEDESSKININIKIDTKLSEKIKVLQSLLENVGKINSEEAEMLAKSIVDWQDADNEPQPDGGAEDNYYYAMNPGYECKDARFQTLQELLLVKGMDSEIFSNIKDIITIFGDDLKVNINTAGFKTFLGLGLDEYDAGRIIEYRNGTDGQPGTDDDEIFTSVSQLVDIIDFPPEDQYKNFLKNNVFTVKSDIFRIISYGHLKKDAPQNGRKIECVIERSSEKPQILYWHQE